MSDDNNNNFKTVFKDLFKSKMEMQSKILPAEELSPDLDESCMGVIHTYEGAAAAKPATIEDTEKILQDSFKDCSLEYNKKPSEKMDTKVTRSKKHSILKESSRPLKIQKIFENSDTDNPETERLKMEAPKVTGKDTVAVGREATLNVTKIKKEIDLDVDSDKLMTPKVNEFQFDDIEIIYENTSIFLENFLNTKGIKKEINLDVPPNELTGPTTEMKPAESINSIEYADPSRILYKQNITANENKPNNHIELNKTFVKQREGSDTHLSEVEFSENKAMHKGISAAPEEASLNATRLKNTVKSHVCNEKLMGSQVDDIEILDSDDLLENDNLCKPFFADMKTEKNILASNKKTLKVCKDKKNLNKFEDSQLQLLNVHSPKKNDTFSRLLSDQKALRSLSAVIKVNVKKPKCNKNFAKRRGNKNVHVLNNTSVKQKDTSGTHEKIIVDEDITVNTVNFEKKGSSTEITASEITKTEISSNNKFFKYDNPTTLLCQKNKLTMCKDMSALLKEKVKLCKIKEENKRDFSIYFKDSISDEKEFIDDQSKVEVPFRQKLTELSEKKGKSVTSLHETLQNKRQRITLQVKDPKRLSIEQRGSTFIIHTKNLPDHHVSKE